MPESEPEATDYQKLVLQKLVQRVSELERAPAPKAPRTMLIFMAFSLTVACVAAGFAGYLWFELDDLTTQTQRTSGSLYSVDRRVDDLESDVGYTYGFDSLSDRVDDLESDVGNTYGYDSLSDRVDDLESDVGSVFGFGSLSSQIDDLESTAFIIGLTIGDLRECVNDYMKTVGDAGGGRYSYYFC